MEAIKVSLTLSDAQALNEFMSRVDLKGAEVPAFNNLMSILSEARRVASLTPQPPKE